MLSLCTEPAVVAKSTIVLEVKPWDTETGKTFSVICSSDGSGSLVTCADMKEVEKLVRGIAKDGLLWGACEFYAPPQTHMHTLQFLSSETGSSGIWHYEAADLLCNRG